MNANQSKIIALGKKLYNLATQGVGGEQTSAQQMLEAYMKKHNLSLTDVEPSARVRRNMKGINREISQMFINFSASILGKDFDIRKLNGRGWYAIYANDVEWLEISEKWPVYRKELCKALLKKKKEQRKEQELLVHAFISKHRLYPADMESKDREELTPEEMADLMQMMRLQGGLTDINFFKKLTN